VNYVYKNIITADPQILIRRKDNGIFLVHKCDIANVDSSDAVVDVYIESYSIAQTIKKHGSNESNFDNVITHDYINKENQEIYYKIKSVTVPVGTTLSLFTDHPCGHNSKFNFIVKSTQNVDVIVDYEHNSTERSRNTTTRTISQY
tara:strand:- start:335 stop:772 length:438 start_codon:yes stop_codon:yes gene_type:complete